MKGQGGASHWSDFDFERLPVMGILRGVDGGSLPGVLDAARGAGLVHIEITLNTPNAQALIRRAVAYAAGGLCIGAGTVLTREEARQAHEAGAAFLVSPALDESVAEYCRSEELPYFPGAFTPTEILKAWNCGAYMVKWFPASRLGPDYLREISGPFENIRIMAVGGIRRNNLQEYFSAGARAIAIGGSIFSKEEMQRCDFGKIHAELAEIVLAVKKISNTIR